jgi:cytochrome P450
MTAPRHVATLPAVPIEAAYWSDRGAYLARLFGRYGPVVRALLGRADVVFLLGPTANQFVLQTHRQFFSNRAGWAWVFGPLPSPPDLLTMDDPEHAEHRRIMHPAFAARRMNAYLPRIAHVIDRRLATWLTRGTVDIYEEARIITFDVAADLFLGLQAPAERSLARAVLLYGDRSRDDAYYTLLRRKIDQRRSQGGDDALGLLARACDERGQALDNAQIISHADVILIAGHETSASLAAWTLYLLVRHPAYARRILDEYGNGPASRAVGEMPVLDLALREAERLYAPVSVVPRVVVEDVEFGGYLLPAGTRVLYSAAATHLLPDLWTEPQRFDPDRFAPPREEHKKAPYALVGFGGGPRVCIGRSVARVELAYFMARALSMFQLEVVPGQEITQRYGVTNRPLRGICLHVRPPAG